MIPRIWIALALAILASTRGAAAQTVPAAPADTSRVEAIEYKIVI